MAPSRDWSKRQSTIDLDRLILSALRRHVEDKVRGAALPSCTSRIRCPVPHFSGPGLRRHQHFRDLPGREPVERLTLWVQVLTGRELDAGGSARDLESATWHPEFAHHLPLQARRQLPHRGHLVPASRPRDLCPDHTRVPKQKVKLAGKAISQVLSGLRLSYQIRSGKRDCFSKLIDT